MLSSASIQANNHTRQATHQDNFESPASITTNSVTDDYDFKTLDISSSAQTSTVSPHKNNHNQNMHKTPQNEEAQFNLNSFSFYSGPATNEKDHISRFRKSLVLSNSFNSISSLPTPDTSISGISKTIQPNEVPTKNLGMVISPSMRALSEILTSKVSLNKSTTNLQQTTIHESENENEVEDADENEDQDNYYNDYYGYEYNSATDTETILHPGVTPQQPVSLIDDVFLPKQSASSDTLQPLDNAIQGDLIDLSSPAVSQKQYSSVSPEKNVNPSLNSNSRLNSVHNSSYNEIYESYSPVENFIKPTSQIEQKPLPENINVASKRVSNRFSTISDVNFNDFQLQSPAILFNDPLETNQFIQPALTKSLSKLTINTEAASADNVDFESEDDSKEFSFIPSRANTIDNRHNHDDLNFHQQTKSLNIENEQKKHNDHLHEAEKPPQKPVVSTFTQTTPKRSSFEFVSDKDDKSPFLNDYLKTINASHDKNFQFNDVQTISSSALGISTTITPKLENVDTLGRNNVATTSDVVFETPKISEVPKLENNSSPAANVFNSSPIRNTSPTFENYKNSPTASPKKNVIKLSSIEKPSDFKNTDSPNQSSLNKLKPAKPKSKLTFKSFFSKSTDNLAQPDKQKKKSPLLPSSDKFQRAKSFNFATKDSSQTSEVKNNKKEKTKSLGLLSGWKRKSLGFNKESSKEATTMNTSKSSNNIFSKSHYKTQSTASLPVLSSPKVAKGNETPKSPHKHSKSTTELFNKNLPDLPPPHLKETSLLEMYGFVDGAENKSPIISHSPDINFGAYDSFRDSTVKETVSKRSLESANSPIDLPQPQSAIFSETTPIVDDKKFDASNQKVMPNNESNVINSSSVYDTTNEAENVAHLYDEELSFFKQPQKIGTPNLDSQQSDSFEDVHLLKTPTPTSPSMSIVESFIQSPNKYHIGDDMFPKKLGINEIESIVSLERSRSFRSVKSHQQNNALNQKNSILRIVQNTNNDFNEIKLPDGMVVVKSPMVDQISVLSKPSRKSSILKKSVSFGSRNSPQISNGRSSSIKDSMKSITSSALDDEFNELIDLIHFGDDDSQLNTDFNIDTAMHVSISPLQRIPRDSSVPDFLGIETGNISTNLDDTESHQGARWDYNMFDDLDNENFDKVEIDSSGRLSEENEAPPTPPPHTEIHEPETFYNDQNYYSGDENQIEYEYVDDNAGFYDDDEFMIESQFQTETSPVYQKKVENTDQNGYSTETFRDHRSIGFQAPLKNASFNAELKPATQSAIFGSLINQRPVDTIVQSDSEISISYADYANFDANYPETNPVNPLTTQKEHSPSRFSVNNPFTDYTQSYDDDEIVTEPPLGPFNAGKFERRKSLDFSRPTTQIKPVHAPSLSLPAQQQNKPKTLKKKNRTSVSFGSMFESLITSKETTPRGVRFSSRILLYDTYGEEEYDRKPDSATCNSLTPQIALEIKNELNALKSEMPVHEDSRCYTHFF